MFSIFGPIFLDIYVFSTLHYSFSRISHEEEYIMYIIYPSGPIPPWLYTVPGFLRDIEDVHPDVGAGSNKIQVGRGVLVPG